MEQLQQYLDAAWALVAANYRPVLAALVILVIGRMVAGWVRMITRKSLKRGEIDATLVPFIAKLAYWAVMAIVVIRRSRRWSCPQGHPRKLRFGCHAPGLPAV